MRRNMPVNLERVCIFILMKKVSNLVYCVQMGSWDDAFKFYWHGSSDANPLHLVSRDCSATRLNISWMAVVLPTKHTAIFRPFGGMSQTPHLGQAFNSS